MLPFLAIENNLDNVFDKKAKRWGSYGGHGKSFFLVDIYRSHMETIRETIARWNREMPAGGILLQERARYEHSFSWSWPRILPGTYTQCIFSCCGLCLCWVHLWLLELLDKNSQVASRTPACRSEFLLVVSGLEPLHRRLSIRTVDLQLRNLVVIS